MKTPEQRAREVADELENDCGQIGIVSILASAFKEYAHEARNTVLEEIVEDRGLLEVGRKAVEDTLIEWRDMRLSEVGRRNGLVIREKDGSESSLVRFGPETALRIGLLAIAKHRKPPAVEGEVSGG